MLVRTNKKKRKEEEEQKQFAHNSDSKQQQQNKGMRPTLAICSQQCWPVVRTNKKKNKTEQFAHKKNVYTRVVRTNKRNAFKN